MHPIGSTEAKEVPISSSPTLPPLLFSLVPSSFYLPSSIVLSDQILIFICFFSFFRFYF